VGFNKLLKRGIVIFAFSALFFIYRLYDPTENSNFPRCPFLYLTGYKCMGCGTQRAIHKLLNLDFIGAMKENALMVLSIPYLLIGFVFDSIRQPNAKIVKWRNILFGIKAIRIVLIFLISFWILRNIPSLQQYI